MLDTIFREYDIRGIVASELHIDQVYDLGRTIAYYFKHHNPAVTTIVVGMDGRKHSPDIKKRLCAALIDSGLDVIFIGICTSPMLYFALHTLPVDAGLMITASHNPKEYNGLKICLGKKSVWGVQVREIRDLFKQKVRLESEHAGKITERDISTDYINWLVQHFPDLHAMQLPIVIDCGNGTAGTVMPALVNAMRWSAAQLLYADVNGDFPHHEADPVKEKNMMDVKEILATTPAVVGIGLDGDADRMAAMTKSGYLVPGDRMLAIFAQQVVQENPGAAIVMDIKSSAGLLELLDTWGARSCLSPSGHAIIKDQMRLHGALLGGELSCHFFFHDRYFGYDDGIYAMLRLLQILNKPGVTLDGLLELFPKKMSSLEIHLPCLEEYKKAIIDDVKNSFIKRSDVAMITIDGVRAITSYGWGIVRASNTQPMLSVRFESDTEYGLAHIKQEFVQVLSKHFESSELQKKFEL